MTLKWQKTPLPGVVAIQRELRNDERGSFGRFFCARTLDDVGFRKPVAQMNHSITARQGTVRGMHYQVPPFSEEKIVSCLRGTIFDVAVDLRADSPTFLHWHAEILSADNHKSLLIPAGFAHGFQSLSDDCELIYLHSECYNASAEAGVNFKDPALGIKWPLEVSCVSDKDLERPFLPSNFEGIRQ